MGLFNFVKEAGEKLWDNLTDHKGQGEKVTEYLKKLNIPGAEKVQVNVTDGKASVTGDGLTQEQKEKNPGCRGEYRWCQRGREQYHRDRCQRRSHLLYGEVRRYPERHLQNRVR